MADGLIGNDNTCGVNRYVARHPLQGARGIYQAAHLLRALIKLFEFGQRKRVVNGHIEFLRNGTRHNVNVSIGHAQGSSNIADGCPCRHGTKGDDLRNVVGAVFARDVFDDLVATVIAKVNVDIGHGNTLGVEETLKEQIKANGINVCDAECVSNQASRARTTSGAYGNILALCIVDVILND